MSRKLQADLTAKKERLRLLEQRDKLQCEQSFFHFVRQAWPILNPTVPYQAPTYLEYLSEWLELAVKGDVRRLGISIPPRSGKSSLVSVFLPVWRWLHDPSARFLFASHAVDLALKHSKDRAALLESRWFKRRWKTNFRLLAVSANEIRNDRRGHMVATTVQGSTGKGAGVLILDDPHSASDAASDALREADNDRIRGSLMSRLDDPKNSTMIVILQRLHDHDAAAMLQDLGGWEWITLPAIEPEDRTLIFPISKRRWERRTGDLLDATRFPQEVLDKLQHDMGSLNFSGQYLQSPFTPGGTIFKREWWQRYSPAELPTLDQIVVSVDASFKSGSDNSKVAIHSWGMAGPRSYLLETDTAHRSFVQTKEAIRQAVATSGATAVLIEEKANGAAIIEELKNEFAIIAINPGSDSKTARAMACSPDIEAGSVYIPQGDKYEALIDELAKFPKAKFNDNADAISQFLNWRRKRTHGLFALWERKMATAAPPKPTATEPEQVRQLALERKQAATKRLWNGFRR